MIQFVVVYLKENERKKEPKGILVEFQKEKDAL